MASFVLSFFQLDTLDEIWDLIESVSEGFRTYSCISELLCLCCVEILKNLPVHSFNAFIIPILRDCLPNYFMVIILSICLWYASIVATCIAAYFALCHALYN